MAMYDTDLSNFVYIDTPALTGDITLTFPNTTGCLKPCSGGVVIKN